MTMQSGSARKHSKFSASGAERWAICPGSVALSEGIPSKDSVYSIEGTRAHSVLELIVQNSIIEGTIPVATLPRFGKDVPLEMIQYGLNAANFILKLFKNAPGAELMVESRVLLDFIHRDAFGSLDYAVVEHFGTLHILDYKYGRSLVSPKGNLQFIFYSLAVAYQFHWNFKRVRMWTLQPRIKNFDGYAYWEIPIEELKTYIPKFQRAIERVEKYPLEYREGGHCYFCAAKGVCPLKQKAKREKAIAAFSSIQ